MKVYFLALSGTAPRSVTHYAGSLLANADVVIGDAKNLALVNQCVGPNAEKIAFVAPQAEVAYERELQNVVVRHRGDRDAVVIRLVGDDPQVSDHIRSVSPSREKGFLSRERIDFEVVSSVNAGESADLGRSIQLPRTGSLVDVSVVVTRARHQSASITSLLLDQGAIPIVIPVIEIVVTDEARARLDQSIRLQPHGSWIVFSSRNAVASVLSSPSGRALLERSQIACIGLATKTALVDAGLRVDFLPSVAQAETLVREFPPPQSIPSRRAIFFAGDIARPVIEEGLTQRGYTVERIEAYATVRATVSPFVRHRAHDADAIIFTSPSTVSGSVALFGMRHIPPRIVSIGPSTSAAVRSSGLVLSAEASSPQPESLVGALIDSLKQPSSQSHR
ncbi:MAG TPA: uroporphyrinogen-III synthase [Acidimicrobiales bacterium]|nr:uroporphyrinogen-III synthase [Acidimicrobiales bacterium]